MAPSRKSRSVSKRFSSINETASNKNVDNNNKRRQRKRKLSDMLGPQWSKEELERFYRAYRKHGTDWEKVATTVRDRSVEMVEALYTLNRAYLNLPKGYASAAGLIAMMTDHYTNLEESDSEQETNVPVVASRKPQKRARVIKDVDTSSVPDLMQSHSAAYNYGCLTLLKKRRSDSRPWAVGKRTPRVPVSFSYEKDSEEKYISPIRQGQKLKDNALEDDVAHEIALALTEASQRVGSPQVSHTPNRNIETPSPVQNEEHMHAESETTSSKLRGSEMDEGGCELSLGSTEADMGHYTRDKRFREGKRYPGSGRKPEPDENLDNPLDDIKEACSGTEEGKNIGATRGKFEMGIVGTRLARLSNKGPRKRSKKVLFGEGEADAVDALQTLADMSLMLPEVPVDTESSVHVEEQKMGGVVKSKLKRNRSISGVRVASPKKTKGKVSPHDVSPIPKVKDAVNQTNSEITKRGKKVLPSELQSSEIKECVESRLGGSQKVKASDDVVDLISRGNSSRDTAYQKQGKLVKNPEFVSSTDQGRESNDSAPSSVQVLSSKQFNLPTKVRSRRKINTSKPLIDKNIHYSEDIVNGQHGIVLSSFKDRLLNFKKKLSNCLSLYQLRRWCVFEWFYSAIDYPWFAKREFVEYLDHVGLGHVPRLTRVEWGVIRSSLGKPRRFSEQFLKEEKEKLNQYRESVRKHYMELRAGTRDGLPTDLARPLSVGQRIFAIHPRTREIHDGSVLTVEHNRCRIQFDEPELGVEFVMDVDCMPSNPLENLPASFTRQSILNKTIENLNVLKMNGQLSERKTEGYITFAPCENLENADGLLHTSPSTYHISNLLKHGPGGSTNPNTHAITELGETVINQQAINDQPFLLARIQGKDADVQALFELNRALDKKEAVVSELKRMNNEVENQKDGENSLKDSELFKKHYAAVLFQLNEVNEQVSSALFCLRQRNTYQGSNPHGLKPMTCIGEPVGPCSSFDGSADETQESGSHVIEIVVSSRTKAQAMVDAAMLAMSSFKKEGSNMENMEEAIDFVNNHLSTDKSSTAAMRSSIPANPLPSTVAAQDQSSSSTTNIETSTHALGSELDRMSDEKEAQIPSELITQCVATLLMIQKCTERQFPPSDVAQVLDSAVTSLKPCCSQNLPIYADIQKCMGIIRNQILALIPT